MVTGPTSMGRKPIFIFLREQVALQFPEVDEVVGLGARELEIDGRGFVGEAFAHPLVAIATEADGVAPPLVRHFVRRDHVPIGGLGEVAEAEKMLLGFVEETADGQVDEHGPALAVVAGRLLGERDVREGKRAEVLGVDLRGHLSLAELVGQHGRGVERAEAHVGILGRLRE